MIGRDVIFLEKEFIHKGGKGRKIELELENSNKKIDKMDINTPNELIPIDDVSTLVPRRSSRISHPPYRYGFLHENEQELFVLEEIDHGDDQMTYEESISDIDSSKWIDSMKSEMNSMYKN